MPDDGLIDFIRSVSGDAHLAIEENLGDGFVRLKTAEAERRQAKHDIRQVEDVVIEMLRNARDAHARTIYLATSRDGDTKTLTFIDDGDGIPASMHDAIFEPRVTSKLETMVMDDWGVHGRGMALYSIRSNTKSARVVSSDTGQGAAISVDIALDELPERTDQSTLPKLELLDSGEIIVSSGPHNIARMTVEFALRSKDSAKVYLGSNAEIIATLIKNGAPELSDSDLLFCDDIEELPITLRLAACSDASELVSAAASLGLNISERTAHRILAGQISPCEPILAQVMQPLKSAMGRPGSVDIYKDKRGLKISKEDLSEFSRDLENAFASLSKRYYIDLVDEPIIRVGKDAITVKFPFDKEL